MYCMYLQRILHNKLGMSAEYRIRFTSPHHDGPPIIMSRPECYFYYLLLFKNNIVRCVNRKPPLQRVYSD